ncbi:SprT family protein [Caldifermentibacillus hisashii]|jgi:SprT-like protein|uniref:Protein SprT-like n=1 Tax=Caldibacillus thermoamylovorans TaxID=35841 RepID=A0A090KP37_9BACI|nr:MULTISPECIES: SprT family protein [Bacillaceae]PAC32303.1 SprT family protein [Caldifermentibacillus hisashii]CEE00394.1 Protein SprT-like [Caldibacillus thermoamylovorans]
MNDQQLQNLVEKISLEYFNRQFKHKAVFNKRLRTTGGRYILQTGNIEINKKYYDVYGEKELIGIIKHELCHYHLHQNKMGYRHKDQHFKQLASQVGAPRYCTPLPETLERKRSVQIYQYQCSNCGLIYKRKRRVDTNRFVCGKCGGRLVKVDE